MGQRKDSSKDKPRVDWKSVVPMVVHSADSWAELTAGNSVDCSEPGLDERRGLPSAGKSVDWRWVGQWVGQKEGKKKV
jgi:hypothetical protein